MYGAEEAAVEGGAAEGGAADSQRKVRGSTQRCAADAVWESVAQSWKICGEARVRTDRSPFVFKSCRCDAIVADGAKERVI